MTEAYLMQAESTFVRVMRSIGMLPTGRNYQVYLPKREVIIGFFYDKNLSDSGNRFCDYELTDKEKEKFNSNIRKGKFVKKIDINDNLLEGIILLSKELERAEKKFNNTFEALSNVDSFVNYKFKKQS